MVPKVTYFVIQATQVGDELRQPGDLIPEANLWAYVESEVRIGRIQPVLVSTLTQDDQDYLTLFFDEQEKAADAAAKAKPKAEKKAEPQITTDNRLPSYQPLHDTDFPTASKEQEVGPASKERKSA